MSMVQEVSKESNISTDLSEADFSKDRLKKSKALQSAIAYIQENYVEGHKNTN